MLTEPPAALTADIMIAMTTMPVTAPAAPAAAAAVAVRRGPCLLLHSPSPTAGSEATTSTGPRIGRVKEAAAARTRAVSTTANHKNRAGENTCRRFAVGAGAAAPGINSCSRPDRHNGP